MPENVSLALLCGHDYVRVSVCVYTAFAVLEDMGLKDIICSCVLDIVLTFRYVPTRGLCCSSLVCFFSTVETWISAGTLSFRGGPAPYSSERWVEVVYWTRVEHTMPVMPVANDCRPQNVLCITVITPVSWKSLTEPGAQHRPVLDQESEDQFPRPLSGPEN